MKVTTFISSDKILSQMDFETVYKTITALISKGIVSVDDLKTSSTTQYETYIEDGAFLQI